VRSVTLGMHENDAVLLPGAGETPGWRGAKPEPTILQPGHNIWCLAKARRATVLQDAAAYFGTLRQAMLAARHSIIIVGWDIDSRVALVGEEGRPDDDLPAALGPFLTALARRRPELSIRLLLWDYSVLYTLERELLPALALHWNTPPQVELCLDDTVPFGASHHQKVVIVDDAVAFAGGLDLTIRRWDRPDHQPRNRLRVDPQGRPYPPFHDVQVMVDGPAAAALAGLARARWTRAACETLPPVVPAQTDPWPRGVAPDFRNVRIGIARTQAAFRDHPELREVETLLCDMIGAAERNLYVECQFLTSVALAGALIRRLRERPALEVLIVAPKTHHTWLEHRTMLAGRIRFMQAVRAAGLTRQVRLMHPFVRGHLSESEVMVHAKVMIVDDRLLRVGSANLCNRSMGADTECDLVIEATGEADRRAIAAIRNRLFGEHLGMEPARVAERIERTGSLFAVLSVPERGSRGLLPIDDGPLRFNEVPVGIEAAADPHRPIQASEYFADFSDGPPPANPLPVLLRIALLLFPIALLMVAWRYTPLSGLLRPGAFQTTLLAGGSWGPLLAVGLFLLLGLLAFPLNILIIATAAAFGIWPGLGYATVGALISAAATYAVGRWLGPGILRNLLGPRINRISQRVRRNGVMAVTAVRLMPVAPFALVNLVAGATKIRFTDYMMGTALGLLPGVVLMSALGARLFHILEHPTIVNALVLIGLVLACAGVTWLLQKLVSRMRHEA
jgi:phospholipase D1/2